MKIIRPEFELALAEQRVLDQARDAVYSDDIPRQSFRWNQTGFMVQTRTPLENEELFNLLGES